MTHLTSPDRRSSHHAPTGWLDPRGRRLSAIVFILNRLSGLFILLNLYLHLVVLSLLAGGAATWDGFVAFARSPIVLALDVVLIAGLLLHGLNGIRVALVGVGLVERERALFVALLVVGLVLLVVTVIRLFGA
jgi:succinate dehydrogenase / fumarate reductase cytochrome b subunit